MSLQTIEFDLQITPGSIPPVLHLAQYDSGRKFYANLKNGSAAFYPTAGSTAKIKGFNAAGVAWEQEATIFNNTVSFTPAGAATDQFGVMPVTIEITYDGEVLTPLLVVFDIQRAGYTNEEAVRSPEFETAMEAAAAEALTEVGILLAEDQATKTAAMTQPVGVDANGKLWTTPGGGGLSDDAKQRLLACFAHVAWTDEHGQDYYDALEDALYPPADLVSITAVYLQDRPIYDTDDLDAIKASDDLTVTAHYSNGTSAVLDDEDYTLSGTLTVGTSTITVSYGGKTDTISVTVTEGSLYSIPDFSQQTVGGYTVSKINGVYTFKTSKYLPVYIYPDGTVSTTKSNTTWFQTIGGQHLENMLLEVEWSNPNNINLTLQSKFARTDSTGNVYSAGYEMVAGGSGSGGSGVFEIEIETGRSVSCLSFQFLRPSGTGDYASEITASFKIKLYVDGVRYL